MKRLVQAILFLVVIVVVWSYAGDQIKSFFNKTFGSTSETADTSGSSAEIDSDQAYWKAFWKLYPEGYGFGSREEMESLPSFGISDPVLQDLHDVCIRYFDEMDDYSSGFYDGESGMNPDLIRGRWSSDFMPLIRKAKEKYGVPG